MKVKPYLFSISRNLDSLVAALIGFFLIQILAKHSGIGVSPDSVTYLSSARHLLAAHGFRSFDNLPTSDFPIAYPFFLTIISFVTGLDPLQYGQILNGFLFAVLLFVCGGMMNGFTKGSGWYKRILLICLLSSPALLEVYAYLWSETIFLLLTLFFIISISNYLRGAGRKWFFITLVITATACETRYAGVFLIATACGLLFFNSGMRLSKRMSDCFLFGSISLLPLLINIFRNYHMVGMAMGVRPRNQMHFKQILEYFGDVFCEWTVLNKTPASATAMAVFVLMIFSAFVFFSSRNKKMIFGFNHIAAVTGLTYGLFMLVSYSITRYEQFTSRLLCPLFIPLLWTASSWIPVWIEGKSQVKKILTLSFSLLAASWFLNRQFSADWEYYDGVKDAGIPGYREDEFTKTEIVQYLEKNKTSFDPRYPVYSNAGDAFYFVTGNPALQLPFTDFPERINQYYRGYDDHRKEYLVWFNNEENLQMPALEDILRNRKFVLLKQTVDGTVYETDNTLPH